MTLGEYLRTLRQARALSLRKVVELSHSHRASPTGGISLAQLVNIEQGRVAEPGIAKLATLAHIYGVSLGALVSHVSGAMTWRRVKAIAADAERVPELRDYIDEREVAWLRTLLREPGNDADRRRAILRAILLMDGKDLEAAKNALFGIYLKSRKIVDYLARNPEARHWLAGAMRDADKRQPRVRRRETPR